MLLTETIKNSTSAIKKRRATIESKQHAETYARALAQLSQSTGSIKDLHFALKSDGRAISTIVFISFLLPPTVKRRYTT